MEAKPNKKIHGISLESRAKAALSGIENVINSTDTAINLNTSEGGLNISGKALKIEKFNIEEQSLVISGQIDCIRYVETKAPLLKRIFK